MKIKKVGILDPTGKYPNPITGQPYSDVYRHIAETGSPNLKKALQVKDGNILQPIKTVIDFSKWFMIIKLYWLFQEQEQVKP